MLLVVVLAGCGGGGDKDPALSAADRRAELDRWVSRADGVCRKSNEAIADRGWPRTLVELDKAAARAVGDVRAASRAIQGLAPPKGSEERVKPFVASVRELHGLLDRVTETTDAYQPKRLNDLAVDLQTGLQEVEDTSKELGLRYGAKLKRVLRVERRRYRHLYKAEGAIPTLRGGKRGGEAPAEDDSEAA